MVHQSKDPYTLAAQEDRCAPRTRLTIPGQLRPSGGRAFQTVVHDLSISGFSAAALNRMHEGQLCWLTLAGLESLQAQVPHHLVVAVEVAPFGHSHQPRIQPIRGQ